MEDRRKIIFAIRHDVDFLEREGLMDYSLLLAVEQRAGVEGPSKKPEELIQFTGEQEALYQAMIKGRSVPLEN